MRRPERRADTRGQAAILIVAFAACLALAIAAVTDVAGAFLRRQAVASLADGAALAASDAAAATAVHADDDYVAVDEAAAQQAVDAYLRDVGARRDFPGLRVRVQAAGHEVTVSIVVPFRLPVPIPGAVRSSDVRAESSAVMPIY